MAQKRKGIFNRIGQFAQNMVRGKTPVKAAQAGFTSQVQSSPAGLRGAITAANRAGQGQMSVETEKMTKAPTMTKAPQADLDRKAASETTPKSSTVIETPVQPSVDPFAGLTGGARQAEIERQAGLTPTMAPEPEVEQPLTLQAERTQPAQLEAPSLSAQRKALQERLLASMTPDAEEQALQDELAQLRGSVKMGIAGEEGQGRLRTQNIVRGRQAIQQRQGALQEQTLLDRLAAKQAQRQAELGRLQTELGIITGEEQAQAQAQQTMAEQLKPFEFAGNLVQFDPATGQLVTIAEAPAEVADPLVQRKKELEIAKLEQELLGGTGDFNEMLTIKELQDLGIPANMFGITKGQAIEALRSGGFGQTEAQQAQVQELQGKINTINELLEPGSGMRGAVGIGLFSRGGFNAGQRADFLRGVERLISQETLDTLVSLKERGGTLGALSDTELRALQNAATELGGMIIYDKNGNPKGIRAKEEDFIDELNRLKDITFKAIGRAGGQTPYTALESAGYSPDEYWDLINEGYTDQQIISTFGSFNNDLSRSQNGSPNLLRLGQVTGYGSPLWQHGLDIDLQKGDPVPAPVSGTVEFVGERGGFGNQVRIRDANGNSHWLSHLDSADVRPGQQITAGQIVGKGGNTGRTIPGKGGDGSHLDYTVVDARGGYIPPRQIAQFLNQLG